MKKIVIISALVAILAAGGLSAILLHSKNSSPFSARIRKQANLIIFYPDSKSTGYKVDTTSIRYDPSTKVLSYTARGNGSNLTITEQTTPDPFNDIPQYWDTFTTKLQSYTSFDSANGKVALTRPVELKGGQSAIMNAKDTLMFVHPINGDFSQDQWKQLFNNLNSVQ